MEMHSEDHPATDTLPSPRDAEEFEAPARNGFSSPSLASPPTLSHASVPSFRSGSDVSSGMTTSSTPLGQINAARRGGGSGRHPPASMSGHAGGLNQDILAKMKAFSLSRQATSPVLPHAISTGGIPSSTQAKSPLVGGGGPIPGSTHTTPSGPIAGGFSSRFPHTARPHAPNWSSAPSVTGAGSPVNRGGLAAKRLKPGLKLSDAQGESQWNGSGLNGAGQPNGDPSESMFSRYSDMIDTKAGTLFFKNKALIHGGGIEFSSGQSFSISLDEVDRLDELGKGNYGTVYKVRHSRPHLRKPGLGLQGIVSRPPGLEGSHWTLYPSVKPPDSLTGIIMAMKEIRLELDEKKFAQIIMELDVLHRCISPFIIDFYGAFFQEGAVYICVEYMDGGSVDKLYEAGIPENILRKITLSTVMGLKTLKDDHNIIHRDVKPTNILVNTRGQIKICDFGVSGNLVASIAKTNIGCQSYMAPERIAGGGTQQSGGNSDGTYSIQSDVWSLGLSVIECAIGRYPYPPETYTDIFSQLNAIVHGEPPTLPQTGYSDEAHTFVCACLDKNPNNRPTYAMLLRHPWLVPLMLPPTSPRQASEQSGLLMKEGAAPDPALPEEPPADLAASQLPDHHLLPSETEDEEVAAWVRGALGRRQRGTRGDSEKPALHAVALDAVVRSPILEDPSASFLQV